MLMTQSSQRFLALDIFPRHDGLFHDHCKYTGQWSYHLCPVTSCNMAWIYPNRSCISFIYVCSGQCHEFCNAKMEPIFHKAQVLGKIFKRTFIIFLLGFLMYWFPFVHYNDQHQLVGNPFDNTRVMGVLQRIALGYCFASLMVYYLKP